MTCGRLVVMVGLAFAGRWPAPVDADGPAPGRRGSVGAQRGAVPGGCL